MRFNVRGEAILIPLANSKSCRISGEVVRGRTGRYLAEDAQLEAGMSCVLIMAQARPSSGENTDAAGTSE